MMDAPLCGRCGSPASGHAAIGDVRYCHGDDDATPTCYTQATWDEAEVDLDTPADFGCTRRTVTVLIRERLRGHP